MAGQRLLLNMYLGEKRNLIRATECAIHFGETNYEHSDEL